MCKLHRLLSVKIQKIENTIERDHQKRCSIITEVKRTTIGDVLRKTIKEENMNFDKKSINNHVKLFPLMAIYFLPHIVFVMLVLYFMKEYVL